MNVDFSHLHLLLNHFPIIGTIIAAGLFLTSFLLHGEGLRRSSLLLFVAMAFLTIPTFITGVGAQVKLVQDPTISNKLIQRHLGAAELSVWFILVTGGLAGIGLWQGGHRDRVAGWTLAGLAVFSLITIALMARTGNTGGDIRHVEVRAVEQVTTIDSVMAAFEPNASRFTNLMIADKWWWAFLMAMHFVGLVMLVGTIGVFNLRVLGLARQIPIRALNRLIPWGLAGLGINIITGMLAFIGMPAFYAYNLALMLKLVAVLLAMTMMALFYLTSAYRDCEALEPGADAPWHAKIIAGASLFLWFAVIVLGRYIQPFENSIHR
jgi:uncharacterized membrane protein